MRLRGPLLALLFIGLGMIVSCSRDWDGFAIGQCDLRFEADCNRRPEDGCEARLQSDAKNCGSCDNNCEAKKGPGWVCDGGRCVLNRCKPIHTFDCDKDPNTGCETDLTKVNNCGGCDIVCNSTNGEAACTNRQCTITCVPGFSDCDGLVTTGCETNLSDDVAHCGACGAGCTPQNVTKPICSAGNCGYAACLPGYSDCDAKPNNGCETPAPSCCKDGVKNGNETGVDCGGNCPPCPPTCNDGVKNGDETYKDCGGSCPVCWFCKNGVQNPGFGEKGIDCGGSCPACCGDGKKNGNETAVDCGGGCFKCPACRNGKKDNGESGIDCGGGICGEIGRFCPFQCPKAHYVSNLPPYVAELNWKVWPNPSNKCVVPHTVALVGKPSFACPSPQASIDDCLELPMWGGYPDPRRDCLIRKIRQKGGTQSQINQCLSYNESCFKNLAKNVGVPQSCP